MTHKQIGALGPSLDKLVKAIAKQTNDIVLPSGAIIVNQLGLDTEFSYYEIKVIPRLSLLKYTENRRIFQNLNAVEIVVGLLNANQVEFETRLTNTYEKREYCVQYDESDFNFISRLLEDEGIFYFFTFKNGNHTFVLGDSIE